MTAESPVIVQSPADHRKYKVLQLPNGLRAILIQDPQIDINSTSADDAGKQGGPEHKEIVDDDASVGGMSDEDDSHSDGSDESSSEDDEDQSGGSDEEDEHEHVRPHHPRTANDSGGAGGGGVKKSAAALSVGIGHFSDPDHLQGLSHYLEHMLFMGSEKYPDENDYDSFLSANSGSSNACTEEESTTYHFDCAPAALEGALDRFAQFFVAPLIKADALEREILAVDNEFSGVLQNDGCRQLQLRAHTARQGHPASKFGWGNRKSLVEDPAAAGIDVRAELLRHYKEQYSAERMNLVVLGGESLEVLQQWVVEKFSPVPSERGARPRYDAFGYPFSAAEDAHGGRFAVLPAVRDEHRLSAIFQLPCLEKEYRKKSEEYLSHLIGHEGRGSLLAALKARGWASDLCAGVSDQTSAAFLFEVSISLTESGIEAGPGCGLAAAEVLFQYLDMLRAAEAQRWAWDEMATIGGMKWKFLEEDDAAEYVAQMAGDMHLYPLEHTLVGAYLHEEFDPELISNLLDKMTPGSVRLDLQTKAFEECKKVFLEEILGGGGNGADGNGVKAAEGVKIGEEPWFKIPFLLAPLPQTILTEWTSATKPPPEDLSLPPPNPYLPSDFTLKSAAHDSTNATTTTTPRTTTTDDDDVVMKEQENAVAAATGAAAGFPSPPEIVAEEAGVRIWHKLDSTFNVPRSNAFFRVSLPNAYSSPRAAALTHLVVKLLEDSLCEEAYLADVAGLHYNIWFEGLQGIDIKVDGFSHKLHLLALYIFQTLASLQVIDEDFSRVLESLQRSYRNANMKPMKHASYLRLRVLKAQLWPIEDVRKELESTTAADVRSFLPTLLKDAHVEALIFGNVTAKEACTLGESARAALSAVGTSILGDRALCLPRPFSSLLVRASVVNSDEENSALESYYQCGLSGDAVGRALLDLVDQIIYEPCYDTLRTKEQLGYTVSSGPRLTHGVSAFCVVVQSGVHGPVHLDSRVDAFLEKFAERLVEMSPSEFEKNRAALIGNKMMKDRNLGEEAERAWDGIVNRGQDFKQKEEEVAAIKVLTQQQVIDFFKAKFSPGGAERRKLAVYVVGKAHGEDLSVGVAAGVEEVKVEEVKEVQQRFEFYPAVEVVVVGAAAQNV